MRFGSLSVPPTIDVLILCALQDEYTQLLNVNHDILEPGWVQRKNTRGWRVSEASFIAADGEPLRVLASFSSDMGREPTLTLITQLLSEHPARCLAMSGICAGRRGKLTLGDVIFADRLYSYDAGKATVENGISKFEGDPLQFHPTPVWKQRIQIAATTPVGTWVSERPALTHEYQEDWVLLQRLGNIDPKSHRQFQEECPDWPAVLKRLWLRGWLAQPMELTPSGKARAEELRLLYQFTIPKPPAFQIHVAPIATGAAVTEDTGIFPRLAESMRKILGVDMEASALGVAGEFAGLPVVVVKGVSDYGDPFKDDRYRTFAARAAAECLISLMKNATDLLPARQQKLISPPASGTAGMARDLIQLLADTYSDSSAIRAIWQRAGGRAGEVENIARPQDLWQHLWQRSTDGAAATPSNLLREALEDLPGNVLLKQYLAEWQNT